tara:strand:- start:1198 stop:2229 length:1032 start_codon:yes stop_codon:yes gene_type:complete
LNNNQLKVAIAGYGVVGRRRRNVIDKNPFMRTVSVSDIKFENSGKFEDGVRYYQNYNDVFEEDLDVLFVSLPNYLAPEATMMGLKSGCHVFCEKPPARTVNEVQDVIKCSERYPQLKLKYGFNHRYHDSVKKAREIIDSKFLGEVVSFRGVYGKSSIISFGSGWRAEKKYAGGGILLDQGIHMLDLVRYFSGDFEEIYSFVTNDYWEHDVEDNAFILMRNKEGQVACLHSTATQWQHRFRLEIILREGLIELTGILSSSKSYGSETLKIIERAKGESTGSQEEKVFTFLNDNSWKDEIDEFADCIVNNKPVENGTSYDALKVMEMIFSVYEADKVWWKAFGNK